MTRVSGFYPVAATVEFVSRDRQVDPVPPSPMLDALTDADRERLAAILEDYLEGVERGVASDPGQLVSQHPELAEPLRCALQGLNVVRQVVSAFPSSGRYLPPAEIGDYHIVREIGRGGMGIVYEARQVSLGRNVAVKVLPFAAVLDQNQVLRFQNEAQAAAQLNHPHIVPVFAVGSERGVHYYSMQYIEGQSLDQALGDMRATMAGAPPGNLIKKAPASGRNTGTLRGFTTEPSIHNRHYVRASVELMIQAAEALHYAHECGVIHRDVKPSNLLVDRQGKLWVTDFGLARFVSQSPLTTAGNICGTLRYMSPEQASGQTALVDQRTDVYALGVTLYETLTLRTPFLADNREELLQQISTVEPQPVRQLNSAVPTDLETIVLKALSKSREERYGTAGEMAVDLRRFLDGRPTIARRPTGWDRAARWVSRRARLVVAALLVLTIGFAGAATLAVAFARMKDRTENALADAELHLLAARKTVDDFGARLSEQLAEVPGAESIRLETLERARQFYEEFLQYAGNDRRWRRDVAIATAKRASVLQQLGRDAEAELAYRQSRQLLNQLRVADPDDVEIGEEAAWCDVQLGLLLTERGASPEGCQILTAACHSLQAVARGKPDDSQLLDDLIRVRIRLAEAWRQSGEPQRAKGLLSETVAAAGTLVATDPENAAYRTRMASALNNLAALGLDADPRASAELFCQAAGLLGDLVRHDPNNVRFRSEWAVTLNNQAMLAEKMGQLDESLAYLDQALQQQRVAYEQSQSDPRYGKLLQQHEDNRDRILRRQDGSRRMAESHSEVEGPT